MSLDMRLLIVSDETEGSERSEPIVVGLMELFGKNGATGPDKADVYVTILSRA